MNLTVNVIQTDFTAEMALVVDPGGISINGNTNGAPASSHVVAVTDFASADISVDQAGFRPYAMTIDNVYDQDATFTVYMIPVITNIADSNYLRPRPFFNAFVDPCTFCVDVYSASSLQGNVSWYVNNELFQDGTKAKVCFCNPGDFQIKVRNQTSEFRTTGPDGNCPAEVQLWDQLFANTVEGNTVSGDIADFQTYLDADTATNTTIVEYRLDISTSLTTAVDPLALDGDGCCYTRNEEVTILPEITLNRPGADPALHTLTYNIQDPEGLAITLPSVTLNDPLETTIVLEKLGVYTVTITVEDQYCSNTFTKVLEIETCNFILADYVDCGTYDIKNNSSATDAVLDISNIDGTVIVSQQALAAGQTYQVAFDDVSIYTVTATYTKAGETSPTTETYILNNYCQLDECIASYILDILCDDSERCDPCPDDVALNQIMMLSYGYFNRLNAEYGWNNFYSGIDDTKSAELMEIKQVMDKLSTFCSRVACKTNGAESAYQGEGPYDWAGKGSNCDKSCNCKNSSQPGYCKTCGGK